ncbi:MAG: DegV family EDD domain-containing protein [Chloroflexota bacterium]
MNPISILTDGTVQFPVPTFEGRRLVHRISMHTQVGGDFYENSEGIKAGVFPMTIVNDFSHQIIPPSVKDFEAMLANLTSHYDEVLVILHSNDLSDTFKNAEKAVEVIQGQSRIKVIDAGTTAIGLGLVVQEAAKAAEAGGQAAEIEEMIRSLLSRVYSVFCIEGLTYLKHSGYLGEAQSYVGEFLKMLPVFTLDNGRLNPTQKARNYRHLVDILHEFLFEFEHIEHIAFLQGVPPFENETKALRERIALDFAGTTISEHIISTPLAGIIGPRSLGMFVLQNEEE